MRWVGSVTMYFVSHRPAARNVIGLVLDIGHRSCSGGNIHAADIEAYSVSGLELIGRRQNVNLVLDDCSGLDRLDRLARELVERFPWFRPHWIERPIGSLQPAPRQLALRKIARHEPFAFARRAHGNIGADVLEHDDPVCVGLVDGCIERQGDRPGDQEIMRS